MMLALMGWGFDGFLCVSGFSVSLGDHVNLGAELVLQESMELHSLSQVNLTTRSLMCVTVNCNGHLLHFTWKYLLDE